MFLTRFCVNLCHLIWSWFGNHTNHQTISTLSNSRRAVSAGLSCLNWEIYCPPFPGYFTVAVKSCFTYPPLLSIFHLDFKKSPQNIMGSTESFQPLADSALFKPVQLGALHLNHRLVLSPLTRMRGSKESDGVWAPGDMSVEYYSQRASKGGFMLTEATPISRLVSGSRLGWTLQTATMT
jgi:NADH:flavin oxidoreductase / NADH oxidase family